MKLQEVYASEQNAIGSWVQIGYKDPSGSSTGGSTTNFAYTNDATNAATAAWKATSSVGLNDCQTGTIWAIGSSYASSTGNVTATPGFKASGTGCTVDGLTPNFCKIGQATSCTTLQ